MRTPKPLRVQMSCYIDIEDAEYITRIAHERDLKVSDITRAAIKVWINTQKDNPNVWLNSTRQL